MTLATLLLRRRWCTATVIVLAALAASGIAGAAEPAKNKDPLERLNRATFAFNDGLDRMIVHPAARFYVWAVPTAARTAVSNFLNNLQYPTTAINNVLQGKVRTGLSDAGRFVVNTTVGIGGLFDPATHIGLVRHNEDFGQTLGWWGVPPGPYIVLPVAGPSDLRDAPALYVDHYTDLAHYAPHAVRTKVGYFIAGARGIDTRSQLLSLDATLKAAFDPYALIRDSYVQRRNYLVHDGNVPEEQLEEPPPDDTPPPDANPAPAAPPPAGH